MLDFLLNHSIHIIFLITAVGLGCYEYKRYLRRTGMSPQEFRSSVRERFDGLGNELLIKLAVSVLVSLVISLVSFRELWMNDVFHIVFMANLLSKPTYLGLKRLLK